MNVFKRIWIGLNLKPKATHQSTTMGDLEVYSPDARIYYHNGTVNSPLVTEATNPSITAKEEGSTLTTAVTSLDFVGAGVTATNTGGAVTVTVSSGGDVVGPAVAVDNSLPLFDGITGKLLKQSLGTGFVKTTAGVVSNTSTINAATEVSGVLPIANGGTNSSTALSGSSIAISNGTAIVQGPAGTSTQVLHGNASGAPTYSALSLTADVSGVLPLANGGTNKNMTPIAGGAVYTDADSLEVTAAGTSGQVLTSNGASAPTWTTIAGTVSTSLDSADAATTYVTDQAGNVFSRWEGLPDVLEFQALTDNIFDHTDSAFSSNLEYLSISTTTGASIYKRAGESYSLFLQNIGGANYNSTDFEYDGSHVIFGKTASPFYELYSRSNRTFTLLTTPLDTAPTGIAQWARYNFDASKLAIAHNTSPFVSFYTMSSGGSVGTKIANPATLPTGNGNSVSWTPAGDFVTVAHATTPFMTTYFVSGSTFTKLTSADPTLPTGIPTACAWSPNGNYLAIVHATAPYISVYKKTGSGASSTLTKLTIPARLGTVTTVGGVDWHPNGNFLVTGGSIAPSIQVYSVDSGTDTFTLVTNAYGKPGAADIDSAGVRISPDGQFTFVSCWVGFANSAGITEQGLLFRGSIAPPVNIRKNTY